MSEYARGYFETSARWDAGFSAAYPWMKWDAYVGTDAYGNGKSSPFPVIKSEAELATALGPNSAAAPKLRKALLAMQAAHRKAMKTADDTYIQVNTGHSYIGKKFSMVANKMTSVKQIVRSSNLIAQNPKNSDGVRYPDSTIYGFRSGSTDVGVGPLSSDRAGSTSQDIYVLDCSFSCAHSSQMETISLGRLDTGLFKTFNGMGIRPYGYQNTLEDAASMAPAAMLISKVALEAGAPKTALEEKPVDSFDTAQLAADSYSSEWTGAQAHGLYKGNDVLEAALAALEAIALLKKYFASAGPASTSPAAGLLNGIDNSSLDIGILAWRKSMMSALNALTANHVGLKGGNNGDIKVDGSSDTYKLGEIYPWFVAQDGYTNQDGYADIDHDILLSQVAVAASPSKNRALATPYLAAKLPARTDSVFKLKQTSADTISLVTAASETPVTYQMCADLLGFDQASAPSPSNLSSPVVYKIATGLDGQNHVHKGVFGVRLDQTCDAVVSKVVVADLTTDDVGHKPFQGLGSEETQLAFGVNKPGRPESGVNNIRAVSLNGVTDVVVEDVVLEGSTSASSAFGVDVSGKSTRVEVKNVSVDSVSAGESGVFAQPFGEQKVIGVKVRKGSSEVKVSSVKVKDLSADHDGLTKAVELDAEDSKLS